MNKNSVTDCCGCMFRSKKQQVSQHQPVGNKGVARARLAPARESSIGSKGGVFEVLWGVGVGMGGGNGA